MEQPAVLFELGPAERPSQVPTLLARAKVFAVLYTFSNLFALNVFNVGHPAEP